MILTLKDRERTRQVAQALMALSTEDLKKVYFILLGMKLAKGEKV